jgi:hypothetical protein
MHHLSDDKKLLFRNTVLKSLVFVIETAVCFYDVRGKFPNTIQVKLHVEMIKPMPSSIYVARNMAV